MACGDMHSSKEGLLVAKSDGYLNEKVDELVAAPSPTSQQVHAICTCIAIVKFQGS
jgi:hypothetical protein